MKCRSVSLSIAVCALLTPVGRAAEYPAFTFPQLASGQGISCKIVLTNPGAEGVSGTVSFIDSDGDPLFVSLGGEPVDSWEFTLPSGGSGRRATGSEGPLAVGYAEVRISRLGAPISGTLIFHLAGSEVSVPAGSLVTESHVFVDQSGGCNSGVAVANSSAEALHLQLLALDSTGTQLESAEREIPPLAKIAEFVPALMEGLPEDFTGTLHLVGDRGFTMIGLRQRSSGVLSTLSGSNRALVSSVPVRFVASTREGLMHVTTDGQITKAMDRKSYALDTYEGKVFIGWARRLEVYDSAYRLIRTIDLDESISFLRLTVLPGERIAFVDNDTDQIQIIDFDGHLLASVAMPPSPQDLQNVSPVVADGDLIIAETGAGQLFVVDLRTYESNVFRDLNSELTGNLGPLAYADGVFYLAVGGNRIYRFTEDGPVTLLATLPNSGTSGIKIVGDTAYVLAIQDGTLYAVDLQSGASQPVATGLDRPTALAFAPGTGR